MGILDFRGLLCRMDGDIKGCLLYTSDAADDLLCVDLGGRRIIKQKKKKKKTQKGRVIRIYWENMTRA